MTNRQSDEAVELVRIQREVAFETGQYVSQGAIDAVIRHARTTTPVDAGLVEIAKTLLARWDDFQGSDGNQQEAYYRLAKNAWNDWEQLRAALEAIVSSPVGDAK